MEAEEVVNMNENKPVRLYKKEPLTVEYEETTVLLAGALFISTLLVLAFVIGTESLNYLFWRDRKSVV